MPIADATDSQQGSHPDLHDLSSVQKAHCENSRTASRGDASGWELFVEEQYRQEATPIHMEEESEIRQ